MDSPFGEKKEESGRFLNDLRNRPDSFADGLNADNGLGCTPVGVTEHAQSLHLKPVNRGWCQTGNRNRPLNGGCGDCRPRTGGRSVHYRITDEIRLAAGYRFDGGDDLTGIDAVIDG